MHQRHVISLLIRGFLSVNARLKIAFGTAFYAIMGVNFTFCMQFTGEVTSVVVEINMIGLY